MDNYLIAIDDQADILTLIARAAEDIGFRVATTTDPFAFKTMIRTERPTAILLDLQMPECDGIELLRFLFEEQCPAQVSLVSGADARVITVATGVGQQLGLKMARPLHKPFRIPDLKAALTGLLNAQSEVDVEMLRQALDNDEITLYFQPLIDLRHNRLVGWEALARWHHPETGWIMPEQFISIAERNGLIDRLTQHVLGLAVEQLAEWRDHQQVELHDSFIAVNLSAPNLTDGELPDWIARLCQQHDVAPTLLHLELTETAAATDSVRFAEVLTRLRVKGFKLAIDDFGIGYSSMLQLYRLPFSSLKIDKMFVLNMTSSEEADVIVTAIIGLAHALHLEVIAEGVETEEVAERLAERGCELAQGYHFGRPMPAHAVPGWCTMNSRFFPV